MGKLSKIIRSESLTIPLQMLYYHSCSSIEAWLSLVERCVRDVKVQVKISYFRRVAQLGRALRSGRRSRRFKSCHADFSLKIRAFLKARIFLLSFFY